MQLYENILVPVFLRILGWAWILVLTGCLLILIPLLIVPRAISRIGGRQRVPSAIWLLVRPFVKQFPSAVAWNGRMRRSFQLIVQNMCELQYVHRCPGYVKVAPERLRIEFTQHLERRRVNAYLIGPMYGWSGDDHYGRSSAPIDPARCSDFVGIRLDVLPRRTGWFSVFVQRHELQHELQRCFDGAHDSQREKHSEREEDANSSAFEYLVIIGKANAWRRAVWAFRCLIGAMGESKIFLCLLSLVIFPLGFWCANVYGLGPVFSALVNISALGGVIVLFNDLVR